MIFDYSKFRSIPHARTDSPVQSTPVSGVKKQRWQPEQGLCDVLRGLADRLSNFAKGALSAFGESLKNAIFCFDVNNIATDVASNHPEPREELGSHVLGRIQGDFKHRKETAERKADIERRLENQWERTQEQFAFEDQSKARPIRNHRDSDPVLFTYETAPKKMPVLMVNGAPWGDEKLDISTELPQVGNFAVGIAHAKGVRSKMEDSHIAVEFTVKIAGREYKGQLFGIFDGHGGAGVANYLSNNLQKVLEKQLRSCNPNELSDHGVFTALKNTFKELNENLKKESPEMGKEQGSTATVAMVLDGNIWCANIGDSRTVLSDGGTPMQLTQDAELSDPYYKDKIKIKPQFEDGTAQFITGRGGDQRVQVKRPLLDEHGNLQYHKQWGLLTERFDLPMPGSIGDLAFEGVISRTPKITKLPIEQVQAGSHLILACDGIYDVASTRQVVEGVHSDQQSDLDARARNLVYSAYANGSEDNLSAMVVELK